MEKCDGGWMLKDQLSLGRVINIAFKDPDYKLEMMYFLMETMVDSFDKKTGIATFRQELPNTLPSQEYFDVWVRQSINSTAKAAFDKIYLENAIAANINATIMCDNVFTANLLEQNFDAKETIQTFSANQLISLDLPFIKNIDLDKLMSIRKYEENVFTNSELS